jgi:hypothetical protein
MDYTKPVLSPEQEAFVNSRSIAALTFGPKIFYSLNGLLKEQFLSEIPIYGLKMWKDSGQFGRKLVWEKGTWKDFDSFKKRQVLLDHVGIVYAAVGILAILYFLFKMLFVVLGRF